MLVNSFRGVHATPSLRPARFLPLRTPQTHSLLRQRITQPSSRYALSPLFNNRTIIANFSSTSRHHEQPSTPTTTTTTTTPTTTITSPAQPIPHSPALNPPLTTFPAPLSLPSKDPTTSQFKHLFSLGKAYLTFYKTGLKNVYNNYRAALPLRRRLGLPILLPTSPPPPSYSAKHVNNAALLKAYANQVTRAEFQLIRRAAYDVRRMIPFSLILLICGEMTPFVVLALGNRVTPVTCRVPKQVEKERVKACERKEGAVRAAAVDAAAAATNAAGGEGVKGAKERAIANLDVLLNASAIPHTVDVNGLVNHASTRGVMRACAAFGLSGGHEVAGASWLPGFLQAEMVNQVYRPRLRRWLRYLEVDDWLIVRNGGVKGLSREEVRIAVEQRGGVDVSVGLGEAEAEGVERGWLENWVEGRGGEMMVERWNVELSEGDGR
ncbi:hypothetical protein AJ79_05164 [Helicocarpus griseus UAMH5409]|uniref:Letm1 RBD domain-containing protein n=1 Tax=Helicocarpus griseus UAMH5409 TaxID=1447875 RepID=A0A2B7XPL8_9EURO|nr:hypothetical protein AJ79_05164 [Helicocarpus griseus UAMH5409]